MALEGARLGRVIGEPTDNKSRRETRHAAAAIGPEALDKPPDRGLGGEQGARLLAQFAGRCVSERHVAGLDAAGGRRPPACVERRVGAAADE